MVKTAVKRALVSRGLKTFQDAAAFLAISQSSLRRLIVRGEIRSILVGSRRCIPVVELERIAMKGLDDSRTRNRLGSSRRIT
jgi:excisionase family DNA binding protein